MSHHMPEKPPKTAPNPTVNTPKVWSPLVIGSIILVLLFIGSITLAIYYGQQEEEQPPPPVVTTTVAPPAPTTTQVEDQEEDTTTTRQRSTERNKEPDGDGE